MALWSNSKSAQLMTEAFFDAKFALLSLKTFFVEINVLKSFIFPKLVAQAIF